MRHNLQRRRFILPPRWMPKVCMASRVPLVAISSFEMATRNRPWYPRQRRYRDRAYGESRASRHYDIKILRNAFDQALMKFDFVCPHRNDVARWHCRSRNHANALCRLLLGDGVSPPNRRIIHTIRISNAPSFGAWLFNKSNARISRNIDFVYVVMSNKFPRLKIACKCTIRRTIDYKQALRRLIPTG